MKLFSKLFSKATSMGNYSVINGVRYEGNSVVISNGKITVNDKDVTPEAKHITITIHGAVEKLSVDACQKVTVLGDVNRLETMSGDVECKHVYGNVTTMSGDVRCGDIQGGVETMSGDVITK